MAILYINCQKEMLHFQRTNRLGIRCRFKRYLQKFSKSGTVGEIDRAPIHFCEPADITDEHLVIGHNAVAVIVDKNLMLYFLSASQSLMI